MTNYEYLPKSPGKSAIGEVVLKGKCPFCSHKSNFIQVDQQTRSGMIPLCCSGCDSYISYAIDKGEIYPKALPNGIEEFPEDCEEIEKYYREALRCLAANSPNGALTLFRKIIHAVAIHYKIVNRDTNKKIYQMIKDLHNEGHINQKLRKSLLAVKDLGNDGAHINENEPNEEQALNIKGLIEAFLESTILQDRRIGKAREEHPNEYSD